MAHKSTYPAMHKYVGPDLRALLVERDQQVCGVFTALLRIPMSILLPWRETHNKLYLHGDRLHIYDNRSTHIFNETRYWKHVYCPH